MATGKKVNDVLEENFMTAAKFSLEIENIVKAVSYTHLTLPTKA